MEGEHPRFTLEDTIARDLATGKAAKEELGKLREIIKYCAERHPTKNSVVIEISFIANESANNFRELLEKYAEIVVNDE